MTWTVKQSRCISLTLSRFLWSIAPYSSAKVIEQNLCIFSNCTGVFTAVCNQESYGSAATSSFANLTIRNWIISGSRKTISKQSLLVLMQFARVDAIVSARMEIPQPLRTSVSLVLCKSCDCRNNDVILKLRRSIRKLNAAQQRIIWALETIPQRPYRLGD